jgi:hypothetical protein
MNTTVSVYEPRIGPLEHYAILAAGDVRHRQQITVNEMLLDADDILRDAKAKHMPRSHGVKPDKGLKNLAYLDRCRFRGFLAGGMFTDPNPAADVEPGAERRPADVLDAVGAGSAHEAA